MNDKTKRSVWLILVFLIIATVSVGYYLFNKGPVDMKQSRGININAMALYNAFISDSAAAQKQYSDKILLVHGNIHALAVNTEKSQIITLQTGTDGAYINCSMEEDSPGLTPGVSLTLKGICSGLGEGEPLLGIKGDVYLSRCFVIK